MFTAWLYLRGGRRLFGRGRMWPAQRTVSFIAGCAVLMAAGFVPTDTFTAHMIEHIALSMVGPLLMALGAPITLALQSAEDPNRRRLRLVLRSRVAVVLSNPIIGWLLFGGTLVALYTTPLLAASERHPVLHVALHVHLVVVGSLFVWPIVGIDPTPHRLPYGGRLLAALFAAPFHAFIGVALLSASSPVAPSVYPSLADQRRAAGLLLVSGELLTLLLAGVVFRRWLEADRRSAARMDRRLST